MSHTVHPGRPLKVSASPGIASILNGYSSFPNPSAAIYPPVPTPQRDILFHVIVRGQLFKLTYDMIMYDQPNIFTSALLQGYSESDTRTMNIHGRSPAMFAVIYEYLSGYAILPNPDIDLRNLLSDCEYYGLDRLKDELTLPKLGDALSSKHQLSGVIRLEEVASSKPESFRWAANGLVDADDPSQHLLVFVTKVHFSVDITVKANGECSQTAFAIELPSYAANLSSKLLQLRGDNTMDWTAITAETLSSTPFTLNDNEFEGNFGDLVRWVGSFMSPQLSGSAVTGSARSILEPQDPDTIRKLTKAMPGLADSLRIRAYQGQTSLQLSTSFWASELSVIIAPIDGFDSTTSHMDSHSDTGNLVAKILNCNLSTGLHRRKFLKPLVNL